MKSVRTTKLDTRTPLNLVLASSVADPGRFDADPDPTFQADADPDADPDPAPDADPDPAPDPIMS